MKFVIRLILIALVFSNSSLADDFLSTKLKEAATRNGYLAPELINENFDSKKSFAGKKFFESEMMSLNSDISCSSCHLDKFSSSDGIPVAIGVGGHGSGAERVNGPGALVPRNTFALWGRASKDFKSFFWDGKVEKKEGKIISQFLNVPPSEDPLTVAIHLPFLEIREMINDSSSVDKKFKKETLSAAYGIQEILLERIRSNPEFLEAITSAYQIAEHELEFIHVADSIRHFFADKFRLEDSKFSKFMKASGELTIDELKGGMIFYGKGMCSSCHSGPHFSDFDFHVVMFPQLGPGRNGFGVDYGRFNVTFDFNDKYKFRTPPLHNVEKTAPYGHSGSIKLLGDAIKVHYDPLRYSNGIQNSSRDRRDYYARIASTPAEQPIPSSLTETELDRLVMFLKTLSF